MSTHTFKTFGEAGAYLGKASTTAGLLMGGARKVANKELATVAVASVAGFMGGPTKRLRNLGRGSVVRVAAKPNTDGSYLVALTGAGKEIVEKGAKPHVIDAKFKESRRGGGTSRGRLRIGNDWRTGPFHHPGVRGHHPVERGTDAVRPVAPQIYARSFNAALAKAF